MGTRRLIKYGGCLTGIAEERAILKSVRKSHKTRNWQEAEEGKLFSSEAAKFLGVKHGILTNSGSSAGLLALSALELPRGSEVIISAVTFPTIFNIIIQCGCTPVVVDAKVGTYGFSIEDVKNAITKKTKAIIAIHPLGNPVDMPGLMKLVKKYEQKIWVIEDNCDGWGTKIGTRFAGSFGDISITSFHAAHIVSMGVGGGIFTNNRDLANKCRMYRDWGRQADINKSENKKHKTLPKDYNPRFIYEKIGYNFQILELQAAMGRVQLRKTEQIKKARKRNFDYLYENLKDIHYIDQDREYVHAFRMPKVIEGADVCWFSFPVTYFGDRGELLKHLEKNGIETRPMFSGNITRHPAYSEDMYRISGKLDEADYITSHSFWISTHPSLTKSDLKYIVKTFNNFFDEN